MSDDLATARTWAEAYVARGWSPVDLPYRSKRPVREGWQNEEPDLSRFNGAPQNIGLRVGAPSGGLVDVDLDCREAREAAPAFLTATGRRHGRLGAPESHWWYIAAPNLPERTRRFRDVPDAHNKDGQTLVELRSTGGQTVVPPSVHPDGDQYQWSEEGEPAEVDGADLGRRVERLAACALLARHWPGKGARHDTALALAGGMLRHGFTAKQAGHIVGTAARIAGDEEADDRIRAVADTADNLERGRGATGIPRLRELLGADVTQRLCDWLHLTGDQPLTVEPAPVQAAVSDAIPWPKLDEAALYGVAGDFVRLVEPHTEADPAALLIQFIVFFGNAADRRSHYEVEADWHYPNLYAVLVGDTSKGRKGTSEGHVRRLFERVEDEWASRRIMSGLSSGEGLIYQVRDPVEKEVEEKETGKTTAKVVDEGAADKRLLVIESEFASVLKQVERDGNTLSPIVRDAWDKGTLRTLTKNSPLLATDAHVSIVAHVTAQELRKRLSETERGNGFANRFLWVCVRRSKTLAFGGSLVGSDLHEVATRLYNAIEFAQTERCVPWAEETRPIWAAVYPELSAGRPGLLGAVTSRAEAQTVRLALIYALLDCSPEIRPEHLCAALAMWEYVAASAAYIFGASLGDRQADELLQALREAGPEGMTRTAIRDHFSKHLSEARIDSILATLESSCLAFRTNRDTGGRPAEAWIAAEHAAT